MTASTANYHVSADGNVRKCSAKTPEACRAQKAEGMTEQHFTNIQEAQQAYEEVMTKIYPFSEPVLSKPLNLSDTVDMDAQKFDEQKYIENCHEYFEKLNEADKKALHGYVQDTFDDINSALYGTREMTPEIEKEIVALDKALAKNSHKAPKTVWRSFGGGNLNKEFHERGYKVGDTVKFDGYTSTAETSSGLSGVLNSITWYMQETDSNDWEYESEKSLKIKVSEEYSKNGDKGKSTVLCIRPKNAAPVSMLRGRSTEQEWLIPRGAQFKVSEIYENRELTGGNMRDGTYAHVYVLDEI